MHDCAVKTQRKYAKNLCACLVLLFVEFAVCLGQILLSEGYHAAFGRTDSSGHRIGFNEPITVDQIRIMAESILFSDLTADTKMLITSLFLLFLIPLAAASKVGRALFKYYCLHSVLFATLIGLHLGTSLLKGAVWTGESIVEGDLAWMYLIFTWLAAWIPPAFWFVGQSFILLDDKKAKGF